MTARSIFALLAISLLAACSQEQSEPGPGGVSAEDAKALDEAAAKLDAESNGQSADNPESVD